MTSDNKNRWISCQQYLYYTTFFLQPYSHRGFTSFLIIRQKTNYRLIVGMWSCWRTRCISRGCWHLYFYYVIVGIVIVVFFLFFLLPKLCWVDRPPNHPVHYYCLLIVKFSVNYEDEQSFFSFFYLIYYNFILYNQVSTNHRILNNVWLFNYIM